MGLAKRSEIVERIRRILRIACDKESELEGDAATHGASLAAHVRSAQRSIRI
jgi:hypothetical protein